MSASSSSKELDKLLAQYPDIQTIGNNKLKCQLSGHEMNSTLDAVQTYVTGSKFKRLYRLKCLLTKFGQYFEERAPNQLYCKITRRTIAKEGIEIERHINGTRFKRALVKYGASVGDEAHMELDNDEKLSTRNNVKYIEEEDQLSDEDDEDSESSLSAQQENLTDLYPELETSESCDSDFDFRAMDTEMDASAGSKRKLKNNEESKSTKKTRNL